MKKIIFILSFIFFVNQVFPMGKINFIERGKDFYDLQRVLFLFKKNNVDFKLITEEPKGKSLGEYIFKLLYFSADSYKKRTFKIEGELIESKNKNNIIFNLKNYFFLEMKKKHLIKFIDQKFLRIEFW